MKLTVEVNEYDTPEIHYLILRTDERMAYSLDLRLAPIVRWENGEVIRTFRPELMGATTHIFQERSEYNSECCYSPTGACHYREEYVAGKYKPIESINRLILRWAARTKDLGADELIEIRQKVVRPMQKMMKEYREVIE